MLSEIVPAEGVRPGDEILIPRIGAHLVSAVERHETWGMQERPCVSISYFAREQSSYENRARDRSGTRVQLILCEKELRLLDPLEPVAIVRGSEERAVEMRRKMELGQAERWTSKAERMRRAADHDARRRDE